MTRFEKFADRYVEAFGDVGVAAAVAAGVLFASTIALVVLFDWWTTGVRPF